MPITKNAYFRYKILDNCFRNTAKRYFIDDLIETINRALEETDPDTNGISRRQVLADIAFMGSSRGWNIDLERRKDGKRVYYRYADPSFSINNMQLNEMEISQLQSAMNILSRFRGMPQFEWMQELLPRLKQNIAADETPATVMEFDDNPYLKGIEHIGALYNAILYKKVLRINYQPFESEYPFELLIHPYYLKRYNNRWFVFGYNSGNGRYNWNLALDRIKNIEDTTEKYRENDKINWQEYFDDIIGVTRPEDGKVEKLLLHFYDRTGHYIETKPIHGSQRAKWINDQTLEVRLEVMINYELERLLLSYTDQVKILKPVGLAKSIKEKLAKGAAQYN